MNNSKIKKATLALLLVCLSSASTYAYLKLDTSSNPVVNTFMYSSNGSLLDDDPSVTSEFSLLESKATRLSDGNYKLDTSTTVYANSYDVLPGMTIPKDPYITITGKNSVPAYLFIEVDDDLKDNEHFTYNISDDFSLIDVNSTSVTGDVYVYKTTINNTTQNIDKIYLLKDNKIVTSDDDDLEVEDDTTMTFKAYMAQASISDDPATVFDTCF